MKRLALALFTTLSKFIKTFKGSKNEQECAQDFETGVALFRALLYLKGLVPRTQLRIYF